MGIIEGLAARFNLAGDRKFNQNENRVPVGNPEVYAPGISAEDAYKLQLAQQAKKENDYMAAIEMIAKNQAYQADKNTLPNIDADGNPIQYNQLDNRIREYQNNVDPGLAAKWTADRESFK